MGNYYKEPTEFDDFRLLKPGTKVLIEAKVKNSTVSQNKNGGIRSMVYFIFTIY